MGTESDFFYSNINSHKAPIHEVLGKEELFQTIPQDWHVVVTDVKNSTKAVSDGKHSLVNLIATGSIIASLNLARKAGIHIPFFFGGDGATLIVPNTILSPLLQALQQHKKNSLENFQLYLRVGSMPISQVYEEKNRLLISKADMSPILPIPLVLGSGLKYAEDQIKKDEPQSELANEGTDSILDLDGMECRWDKITPPENKQEVLSLLVESLDEEKQGNVFRKVLQEVENIFGNQGSRNPISVQKLRLDASLARIRTEMRVKLGESNFAYLLENWLRTLIGEFYFRFNKGGKMYLDNLVKLSDTLVIDGRINTVISGTVEQRNLLIHKLDQIEQKGDILYGIHSSPESIMSCYVTDREEKHIHFVDGSGGGYTQAAKMLKRKIKEWKEA
ncbi:MAG: DUF3095 family protein [Bacteroidota bacterium]